MVNPLPLYVILFALSQGRSSSRIQSNQPKRVSKSASRLICENRQEENLGSRQQVIFTSLCFAAQRDNCISLQAKSVKHPDRRELTDGEEFFELFFVPSERQ
jgi:hypothetical protein